MRFVPAESAHVWRPGRRGNCVSSGHATPSERIIVQAIVDELRPVNYIAAGTLQRKLELTGEMSRDDFDALLGTMVRAGLIEIEEAEFEKNGEVLRFRKSC